MFYEENRSPFGQIAPPANPFQPAPDVEIIAGDHITVEKDETDEEALKAIRDTFLIIFDMIKLIMISKRL